MLKKGGRMNRIRKLVTSFGVLAALLCTALLTTPSGARANQITIGQLAPSVSISGSGGGAAGTLTLTMGTGSGLADLNGSSYEIGVSIHSTGTSTLSQDILSTGAFNPGNGEFAVTGGNPETYTYASVFGPAESLTGSVTWSVIKDDTSTPDILGSLLITASAGDAPFLTDFQVGKIVPIDVTFADLGNQTLLKDLAANGCVDADLISHGKVGPVPEPSSLLLMGSGLLGLVGLVRKKASKS